MFLIGIKKKPLNISRIGRFKMSDKVLIDLYNNSLQAYKETKSESLKKILSKLIDILMIEIDSRLDITA